MDWTRRTSSVPLIHIALWGTLSLQLGCEPVEELVDSAEIEAQLREDPHRSGKAGQLVGLIVSQHAFAAARGFAANPDPGCTLSAAEPLRWTAELTLERRRGDALHSSWTETRTLDADANGVALEYMATFRTEVGTESVRGAQWRVLADTAYVGTPAADGVLWMRREREERERERVEAHAWGTLQALLDGVGGWTAAGAGRWTAGGDPLRCAQTPPDPFVARFTAAAKPVTATLVRTQDGRELAATWSLADGSTLTATYADRVSPLPEAVAAPPSERVVATAPDRSLAGARQLLETLSQSGLAEVASPVPTQAREDVAN